MSGEDSQLDDMGFQMLDSFGPLSPGCDIASASNLSIGQALQVHASEPGQTSIYESKVVQTLLDANIDEWKLVAALLRRLAMRWGSWSKSLKRQ